MGGVYVNLNQGTLLSAYDTQIWKYGKHYASTDLTSPAYVARYSLEAEGYLVSARNYENETSWI